MFAKLTEDDPGGSASYRVKQECMELRKQWWEEGQKENWTFLFYHDIKSPVWPG